MKACITISTLLMTLGFTSCSDRKVDHAQLQHDLGDPVRSHSHWNWVQLSKKQFYDNVLNFQGNSRQEISSQHKLLIEHAERWVNLFDAKIRKTYPEEMKHVPKPQVTVITDPSPNAFIAAAFTCYKNPISLNRTGAKTPGIYWSQRDQGSLSQWPKELSCIPGSQEALHAAIEEFNQGTGDCKLLELNGTITPGPHCKIEDDLHGIGSADQIVFPRTANWVTIHAGLYKAMKTEAAFVGVLSHELGHYYRSHSTNDGTGYDFFYEALAHNPDHRPIADSSLEEFGRLAQLASRIITRPLGKTENQSIASEAYLAAGSLAELDCSDGVCNESCGQIADWENYPTYNNHIGMFPFSNPAKPRTYEYVESVFKDCLQSIPFGFMAEIDYQQIKEIFANPSWIPFLGNLNPHGQRYVQRANAGFAERLPPTVGTQIDDALELIDHLSQHFNQQRSSSLTTLERAQETGLGHYTTEQEADELSVEWLTLLGFDPKAAVETYLSLAGNSENRLGGLIIGGKNCRELFKQDWVVDGKPIFIPVGDYDEVHHSSCYRAFNADREIDAHGYEQQGSENPTVKIAWKRVVKVATNMTAPRLQPHNSSSHSNLHKWSELLLEGQQNCPMTYGI